MQKNIQVSTIIPTLAEEKRASALKKCIKSVRLSSSIKINIIVVVNGSRFDHELLTWLKQQHDVTLIIEPVPSAPNAIRLGRQAVTTPFFSTLDDDDEYLPQSTDRKLQTLISQPEAALLVTNIQSTQYNNTDQLYYDHLNRVPGDPLGTLFEQNWLASSNALYRSEQICNEFFSDFHPYAEWTWLAFKLALEGKRVATLNEACAKYNYTPDSLSHSAAYRDAYFSLFERMLDCSPPHRIKKMIQRRLSAALHDRSEELLKIGKNREAFAIHLRSLTLPGGWRYLAYSRYLIPGWPRV
jgi:glycosyltransferase involved in cell wall biosynthesis